MKMDTEHTGRKKSPDVEQPPVRTFVSSDDQLRFMAEVMPQKIFTVTPEGMMDYLNPQWYEYTGYTPETLKSDDWNIIVHPDDMPATLDAWMHTIKTGEALGVEHRLRRYDDQYRWHTSRATVMRDEHGEIVKWFGSSTDIHDKKLAIKREQKLTFKTESLARQREKLLELSEAKDEFISLASHQLRTPATVVKQYLSMILEGYVGDINPEVRAMLERADASNNRQIDIVDDLLEVARVDSGKMKLKKNVTNIVPLMQEVINEQSALIESRRQLIKLEYKGSGISAPIDRTRIKMVLENILDNAGKYSNEATTITCSVEQDADLVYIAIQDQGVGIPKKYHAKLFTKFSRLDNPLSITVGGSGLGLYWAKRIVSLHDGRIEVRSSVGKGSTFTVVLPR